MLLIRLKNNKIYDTDLTNTKLPSPKILKKHCVSYNRFVDLQKKVTQPLAVFMKLHCSGISFIDSSPLKVCHYKREKQPQVFKILLKKVTA